jgi:hypothetical protein
MLDRTRSPFLFALLLTALPFSPACGDDDEPAGSGGSTTTGTGGGGGGGTTTGTGSGGSGGGETCADTQSDPANCGACGHPCAPGQTCQDGVCSCGAEGASFAADVQPIFTASCAGTMCHGGAMPKAGLDLTSGNAHASLTGGTGNACMDARPLVVAGQPSESYLMSKLLGTELCIGGQMPPAAPLSQEKIKTIADWICAGAQDN